MTLSFSGYLYSVHIGQIVTFLDYSPNLTPFLSAVSEAPIFPNEILIGILQAFDSFHVESLQNYGVICFVRWQENFIFYECISIFLTNINAGVGANTLGKLNLRLFMERTLAMEEDPQFSRNL